MYPPKITRQSFFVEANSKYAKKGENLIVIVIVMVIIIIVVVSFSILWIMPVYILLSPKPSSIQFIQVDIILCLIYVYIKVFTI
ncbi:hypothetical protein F4703DRAFT_1130403 [Phycomyces blakesleeanus]